MNPNAEHVRHLTPDLRQRLDHGLTLFKQNWTETLMAETLGQMSADHPLRYACAVELTKLDILHRGKLGQRKVLEEYIRRFPELGSAHTVSVELIRHEFKVRRAMGDYVVMEDYARRFPNQYEAFRALTAKEDNSDMGMPHAAQGPVSPAAAFGPRPSPVAAAFDESPGTSRPATRVPTRGPAPLVNVTVQRPAERPTEATPTQPVKRKSRKLLMAGGLLLLLLSAFLGWYATQGGLTNGGFASRDSTNSREPEPQPGDIGPPPLEAVQSVTVKLDLGAGDDLQDPVALDLGLGFPFWLMPSGSQPPTLPFGAVPQETSASGKVPASGSATFKFLTSGDPGQDVLSTTPQLLANLKVGDIRRVGFAGLTHKDWELAGFEIHVNGKTLHSAKGLKVRPKRVQEEAMMKLAELNQTHAVADQELADLRDLSQAGLASDSEKARLEELEKQSLASASPKEKALLEMQLNGQSPWHMEEVPRRPTAVATAALWDIFNPGFDLFMSPAFAAEPVDAPPQSVRVTLVTDASHDQSDTSNYVYFATGGHKYLLGSPDNPLTSDNGPQTFNLDLLTGPLESSDLHDFGLGMLAPAKPLGKGPDRWHARRLQVEVDGRIVYDSEDNPSDLQTLAAIRLVPPSQFDLDGITVVKHPANSREISMWQAGKATGFEPTSGDFHPLPPGTRSEDGAVMPQPVPKPVPKPVVADNRPIQPLDLNKPGDIKKLLDRNTPIDPVPSLPADVNQPFPVADLNSPHSSELFDLNAPRPPSLAAGGMSFGGFPREMPRMSSVNPASLLPFQSAGLLPGQATSLLPFQSTSLLPGQSTSLLPGQFAAPLPGIVFNINKPTPAPIPPPVTKPVNEPTAPQITSVVFDQFRPGPLGTCSLTISWKIADERGVDRYDILLQGTEDNVSMLASKPRGGQRSTALSLGSRPKGIRSLTTTVPASFLLDYRFVVPVVTPVPSNASVNAFGKQGPARSTAMLRSDFLDARFINPQQIQGPPVTVSFPSGFSIHTGFDVFDQNGGVVIPLDGMKPAVTVSRLCNNLQIGAAPRTIRFYTGFSGGNAFGNKVEYRVEAFAFATSAKPGDAPTTFQLKNVTVPGKSADPTSGFFTLDGAEVNLHAVSIDLSALTPRIQASPESWAIELAITMRKFSGDTTQQPVVFDTVVLK